MHRELSIESTNLGFGMTIADMVIDKIVSELCLKSSRTLVSDEVKESIAHP